MAPEARLGFGLHPKQAYAFTSKATEILYGGAAGGGKSFLMRALAIVFALAIPGLQIYLFRRVREDLIKNHVEGPKGFRAMLAPWEAGKFCKVGDEEIKFSNGSKIYLCHCKDEKDRFKYLGAEIHLLLIDEATTFTEVIYRFLRSRVRMVGMTLPQEYIGMFPKIILSSNPGNIGHLWVKAAFIDGVQPYEIRRMSDADGGMLRQYIPAKLQDNPSMAKDDPTYRSKLRGLGSEALVKAMEDGDWNVIQGAYFDCWSERMILPPFEVPPHWTRFRSMDWGFAKPFSVGWWAVAEDDLVSLRGRPERLPRGAIVRYREWYGAKRDDMNRSIPNEGVRMVPKEIAETILRVERGAGERFRNPTEAWAGGEIYYGVADPSMWKADGGPSHAETMATNGVLWKPADNSRIAGWLEMRSRMTAEEPMIYVTSNCVDSIRTIPALQHDITKPEDLDSEMEDHAGDDWRYACMSRPFTQARRQKKLGPKPGTFDHLLQVTSPNTPLPRHDKRTV